MGIRTSLLLGLACAALYCQDATPSLKTLDQAYEANRARDYETAVRLFEQAVSEAPSRASIRKDLGYAYLKIGENEAARDQFAEALRLTPNDDHLALEYAFLCFETKERVKARRIFDRLRRDAADPASRATAEQAFQNIDRPLAEGIARWTKALTLDPDNYSAHYELAVLAEQRDEPGLAGEHYWKAWRLRPELRSLLVDLGRVWKAQGRTEDANSALLAASRGGEPRTAEMARELLPPRYPYVYEFRLALRMDPGNTGLRRELAYLLLEMGFAKEAEAEFAELNRIAPGDLLTAAQLGFLLLARKETDRAMPLLEQVLAGGDDELADRVRATLRIPRTLKSRPETPRSKVSLEAKDLADRSYKAGYLKDALKYYLVAHETDPLDFPVILKLGYTHNLLRQDREAARWFSIARKSPDPAVAREGATAYRNLTGQFSRFHATAWVFPFYSSRWRDTFSYGQIKTEVKLGGFPMRAYLSTRFIGDTRARTGGSLPQYLSESSFLFALGLAAGPWRGFTLWGEAGTAASYLGRRQGTGRFVPDYRGGLAYGKGFGRLIGSERPGAFFETNDDMVFISRFQNDVLLYAQNRAGYTLPPAGAMGNLQLQLCWNINATVDWKRQYWANFVESGPGIRFRWPSLPKSMLFSVNLLRGAYIVEQPPALAPSYYDLRAGFWYAFSH